MAHVSTDKGRRHTGCGCRENGTAFFLKQLGRNPVKDGKAIQLNDLHAAIGRRGRNTSEFPDHFYQYRRDARSRRAGGVAV